MVAAVAREEFARPSHLLILAVLLASSVLLLAPVMIATLSVVAPPLP